MNHANAILPPRAPLLLALLFAALSPALPAQTPPPPPTPAPATPAAPPVEETVITSDTLEMWTTPEGVTQAILTGNVKASATNMRLACDRLELTATNIGDKTATIGNFEKLQRLLATGNVNITQGEREAACGRAELLPREGLVILTENPVVTDHANGSRATGDPIILRRGERRVEGKNISITFPPIRDLGFDKNQQPQPAPVAPASDE
jgi:lipopolysaccharide export system protein LptA